MNSQETSSAITVSALSKSYGGRGGTRALADISFEVERGELFGLIGPDGAGKTTLFRILSTLLLPDGGWARVEGFDTVTGFKEIRDMVGYMPGRFSLYQDLSVEENLNFFARVFNTSIEANYELVRDIYVQIEPFKHRRAGKLSGGMKQKLALCCALIHQPRVLLLDEPTTGVDPVSRKEFWEMLGGLKARGISILVSTPYMDEANLCDRVALIQRGRILSIDTPGRVVDNFDRRVYALRAASNYRLLLSLRGKAVVDTCYMFGEWLHVTLHSDDAEGLARQLDGEGHRGLELKAIKPTIEDCFIGLMGPD